jgi:tetratricopeptide (TPR) repeat protein
VQLLTEGLKSLPNSTDLRAILANVYLSAGDTEKAEEQLRKLIELKPQELAFRQQLALFFLRAGKLDDAQRVLDEAVRALPQSGDAKLALVSFLTSQRTRAQAEQTLRSFIAREPRNYDLRLGLGALLWQSGDAKEALDAYTEIVRLDGLGPAGLTARDQIAQIDAAQGRYDEAGKLIAAVLEQNPHDNDALYLRSSLELEQKDPAAAVADLRSVSRDLPGSIAVRHALARAYILNGEPALAEEQLHTSLEAAPADGAVRLELAHLLLHTDRAEQAAALLERGVQTKPDDVLMREALVRAYLAVGNLGAAHTAAEDVKILAPKSAEGFFLAGVVAQAQQHPADAEKEFERGLQQEPNAAGPLAALTRLQVERGQSAKAVARLQEILKRNPKDELALEILGELYVSTRAFPQAISTFTSAIAVNPKRWVPYRNLAVARAAGGDTAGAVAAYKAGIEAAPTEPQLVVELATYYEKQGRVDDAISLYDKLYQKDPHQQLAANNLAMLLVTYKKDQASLDRARDLTASFASSSDGSLLDTTGWVRLQRGEFRDALTVLERAATLSPQSPVIHYHLAVAELQTGHRENARANLQTALAGSASFPGADRARAMLAGLKGGSG